MDKRNGQLYESFSAAPPEAQPYLIPVNPTPEQVRRGKVFRNEKCPCKSGKKFKKCCLIKAVK